MITRDIAITLNVSFFFDISKYKLLTKIKPTLATTR